MGEKTQFNRVEHFAGAWGDDDEDQAFDQPCVHANRVGGHSVYCHHPGDLGYRKCYYRWSTVEAHEKDECGGYKPNPDYPAVSPSTSG